ncbi:hypothetical protein HPB52_004767 [Rhipicephalus sanguineus]|uniref:Uncharacterized protein n=1 Tax=Rhipicephalus sanguineus TaxID=34632 RepID=A0A9D4SNN7_RHISA|nr:hypothetical protein HPB52_004767 [Rhipicephalus sanguineus]
MQPNADQDATLAQIQTALFGLSLNCALYAVVYTAAASACVDTGLSGGFVRRSTRSQQQRPALGEARARVLSYGRCFAAGVFLAALFLGMMPAVRSAVQAAQEKHGAARGAFPIAEALVFVGFCATVCFEGLIAATTRSAGSTSSSAAARESPEAPQAEPASPSSDSDLVDSRDNSRTRLLRGKMGYVHYMGQVACLDDSDRSPSPFQLVPVGTSWDQSAPIWSQVGTSWDQKTRIYSHYGCSVLTVEL